MQNPNTEPNPKETGSQEEIQHEETQQSKDNKLLSPKTSVLIQPRLRAHMTGLRCSDYSKGKILTTLIKLNRGLAEGTIARAVIGVDEAFCYSSVIALSVLSLSACS
jgi:hypothetical protein